MLMLVQSFPPAVFSQSPVKLKNWQGTIDLNSSDAALPFSLTGSASHLGQFVAHGEVKFVPGEKAETLEGEGVVVFEAASGDLLVGVVQWDAAEDVDGFRSTSLHFSWRDSVQFSDGTIVFSTGRFVDDRPPGLVVNAIIAVLIALLLPAVHTVR